jgi:hypothetical protein
LRYPCRWIVPREGAKTKALVEATQSRDARRTGEFDLIVRTLVSEKGKWNGCAEGIYQLQLLVPWIPSTNNTRMAKKEVRRISN